MTARPKAALEKAFFTDAKRASVRGRWTLFVLLLAVLGFAYWIARDILIARLVHDLAQRTFNDLASATIDTIGSASIDRQGDLTLRGAEAYTLRNGVRRLFFRAEELRIVFDGIPLRDGALRVTRVDLRRPEIFVRREFGGEWNLEWALQKAPRPPDAPAPPPAGPDPWKDYVRPDESFPRNGVHIFDGTVHTTFVSRTGKEATWTSTGVRAVLRKADGPLTVRSAEGRFYGGRIRADIEILKARPLTIRQLTVDVAGADVARMAEGVHFIKYPVSGTFDAVVALTLDREKMQFSRPVASGRLVVEKGNLWALPTFSSVLNLLTLASVEDRKIDSALLEFTVEQDQVRVDKMYFLGYPVSLFGDGAWGLTGDWIEIVFIPRIGKSSWDSILPVIGLPIELLSNIFKGALVPVVLKGSFEKPEISVEPLYFLKPSVKTLIEEKSPR
jgi:hypothetical protein